MKIKNTNDLDSQKLKVLISGPSGAGKTTLMSTLGTGTLGVSLESGLLSVSNSSIDFIDVSKNDKDQVLTEPKDRIARLAEVFHYLHAGCPDQHGKPTYKYTSIFVDSLTEIAETLIQKLQKEFPDRKDSFPMWGEYSKIMRSIIKNFRDLPYNVYMTVLSKPEKDENNKRYMGFNISGSIADQLPQYFDEVFFLHVNADGKRTLITRSTDTLICKDRSNKLSPVEEPNLGAIAKKILFKEEKK